MTDILLPTHVRNTLPEPSVLLKFLYMPPGPVTDEIRNDVACAKLK